MLDPEITVLETLPPLATEPGAEFSRPELAQAFIEVTHVMALAYASHFGLTHLAGKLRVSCYHVEPVTFSDEDSERRTAIGAVIGPKGRPPVLTVLVTVEGKPGVFVCPETQPWIDRFGAGLLPRDSDEIDLDRL